jgi:hypothetical protein
MHTFGSDTDKADFHVICNVIQSDALIFDLVYTHLWSLVPRLCHLLAGRDLKERQESNAILKIGGEVINVKLAFGENRVEPRRESLRVERKGVTETTATSNRWKKSTNQPKPPTITLEDFGQPNRSDQMTCEIRNNQPPSYWCVVFALYLSLSLSLAHSFNDVGVVYCKAWETTNLDLNLFPLFILINAVHGDW